ncbi:MAG TPA: GNAT family N-acetyltransferase [Candidatus Nanoarchaeia archaeon]|nr:GNAT family N-acetyltransferase [Candidatus Nanoarchaeia archaeon]
MIIRPFRSEDAEGIVDVHRSSVRSLEWIYTAGEIAAWTSGNIEGFRTSLTHSICFVAEVNEKIIGFSDVTREGKLRRLYVDPAYSGRGVGSALLRNLEDEALKQGIYQITLSSSIPAVPFYVKRGYIQRENTFETINGVRIRAVGMSKNLIH